MYQKYRNLISTLLKQSKKNYFNHFFSQNINDIKNNWKDIKNIISLKNKQNSLPTALFCEDSLVSDPTKMANLLIITSHL